VRRLDHVFLQIGSEAVLRAEDRRQLPVTAGRESIGGVAESGVNRGRIADDPDALAGNQAAIGSVEEAFDSKSHGHRER
jgi:hypothetical protein